MTPQQLEGLVKGIVACKQARRPAFYWLTPKGGDGDPVLFVDRQERTVRKAGREALRTSKTKTFAFGTVRVEGDELVFVNQGRLPDDEALRTLRTKLATEDALRNVATLLRASVVRSPEEDAPPEEAHEENPLQRARSGLRKLFDRARRMVGALEDALRGRVDHRPTLDALAEQLKKAGASAGDEDDDAPVDAPDDADPKALVVAVVEQADLLGPPVLLSRRERLLARLRTLREQAKGDEETKLLVELKATWDESRDEEAAGDWVESLDTLGDLAERLDERLVRPLKVAVAALSAEVSKPADNPGAPSLSALRVALDRAELQLARVAGEVEDLTVLDEVRAELGRIRRALLARATATSDEVRAEVQDRETQRRTDDTARAQEAYAAWRQRADAGLAQRVPDPQRLGGGTFGDVHPLPGDPPLVVKFLSAYAKEHGITTDEFHKESATYGKIPPHPNLARCLGVRKVPRGVGATGEDALVLEQVQGPTVEAFFQTALADVARGALDRQTYLGAVQHLLRGLVRGLVHMHEAGLRHRDVKPPNLMVDGVTGELRIIDLGTATGSGAGTTTDYVHPDSWSDGTDRVDPAAAGLSAFNMLQGSLPSYRPQKGEVPGTSEAKKAFGDRSRKGGEALYVQGTSDQPADGEVPAVLAIHDLVNLLLSPTFDGARLVEVLSLPFFADSLLSESEGAELVRRLTGAPPTP